MTKLERHILSHAKKIMPQAMKVIKKNKYEAKYVVFPFMVDGVFDSLIYNTETNQFEYIEYSYGIGEGLRIPFQLGKYAAYYNKKEIRRIELNNDKGRGALKINNAPI